jgi:shikimate dehydrogenase
MIAACIIGWPVAHSRSPLIHGYWLKRYGVCGRYVRRAVPPEGVADFLAGMHAEGFVGCNVTLPHKESAYRAAARATAAAAAVAAANTLWFEGDALVADNTDGAAFIEHVRAHAPHFPARGWPIALLGAGGAARAVAHALLQAGACEVRLFNRTRRRAEQVAAHFGARVRVGGWDERREGARGVAALINATSLGMAGAPALDVEVAELEADCIVADVVYVPPITPLLAAARGRGLVAVDGLGMLLHQAVPGFHRWFGVRPEVTDELRALLRKDVGGP